MSTLPQGFRYSKKEAGWMAGLQTAYLKAFDPPLPPMLLMEDQLNGIESTFQRPYHVPTPADFSPLRWVAEMDASTLASSSLITTLATVCDYQFSRLQVKNKFKKGKPTDPINLFFEEFKHWLVFQLPSSQSVEEIESRLQYLSLVKQSNMGRERFERVLTQLEELLQDRLSSARDRETSARLARHLETLQTGSTSLVASLLIFMFYVFRSTPDTPDILPSTLTSLRNPGERRLRRVMQTTSGQCLGYLLSSRLLLQLFPSVGNRNMLFVINSTENAFIGSDNSTLVPDIAANQYVTEPLFGSRTKTKWFETGILATFQTDSKLMEEFLRLHGFAHELARLTIFIQRISQVLRSHSNAQEVPQSATEREHASSLAGQFLASAEARLHLTHLMRLFQAFCGLTSQVLAGLVRHAQQHVDADERTGRQSTNRTQFSSGRQAKRNSHNDSGLSTSRFRETDSEEQDWRCNYQSACFLLERIREEVEAALNAVMAVLQVMETCRVLEPSPPKKPSRRETSRPKQGHVTALLHLVQDACILSNSYLPPEQRVPGVVLPATQHGGGLTQTSDQAALQSARQARRFQMRGEHHLQHGNANEAVSLFLMAIELDPTNAEYRYQIAEAAKMRKENTTIPLPKSNLSDDDVVDHITQQIRANPIEQVILSSNNIGPRGAGALAQCMTNTLLRLDLHNNHIQDQGVSLIADALRGQLSLTSLDVNENGITCKGSLSLAKALETNRTLTFLDLGFNPIQDNGVIAIASVLSLNLDSKLRDLRLSETGIGEPGGHALLVMLKHNSTVERLALSLHEVGAAVHREITGIISSRKRKGQSSGAQPLSCSLLSAGEREQLFERQQHLLQSAFVTQGNLPECLASKDESFVLSPFLLTLYWGAQLPQPSSGHSVGQTSMEFVEAAEQLLQRTLEFQRTRLAATSQMARAEPVQLLCHELKLWLVQKLASCVHDRACLKVVMERRRLLQDLLNKQSDKQSNQPMPGGSSLWDESIRTFLHRTVSRLKQLETRMRSVYVSDKVAGALDQLSNDVKQAVFNLTMLLFFRLRDSPDTPRVFPDGISALRQPQTSQLLRIMSTVSGQCLQFLVSSQALGQLLCPHKQGSQQHSADSNPFVSSNGKVCVPVMVTANIGPFPFVRPPGEGGVESGVLPVLGKNPKLIEAFLALHAHTFELARVGAVLCDAARLSKMSPQADLHPRAHPQLCALLTCLRGLSSTLRTQIQFLCDKTEQYYTAFRKGQHNGNAEWQYNYNVSVFHSNASLKTLKHCEKSVRELIKGIRAFQDLPVPDDSSAGVEALDQSTHEETINLFLVAVDNAFLCVNNILPAELQTSDPLLTPRGSRSNTTGRRVDSVLARPGSFADPNSLFSFTDSFLESPHKVRPLTPREARTHGREDSMRANNLQANSAQAKTYAAQGLKLLKEKKLDDVIKYLTLAIELDPSNGEYAMHVSRVALLRDKAANICRPKQGLDDEAAGKIAEEVRHNAVELLELSTNRIGPKGAQAIFRALELSNTSLTTLDLYKNQIGDAGAKGLAQVLKQHPSLHKVDVNENNIGPAGCAHIASALLDNSALTFLNLGFNPITDAGAKAIAEALVNNKDTRMLDLRLAGTQLSNQGGQALRKMLLRVSLHQLTLSDNERMDKALVRGMTRTCKQRLHLFHQLPAHERERVQAAQSRLSRTDCVTYCQSTLQLLHQWHSITSATTTTAPATRQQMLVDLYMHLRAFPLVAGQLVTNLHNDDYQLKAAYEGLVQLLMLTVCRADMAGITRESETRARMDTEGGGDPQDPFAASVGACVTQWLEILHHVAFEVKACLAELLRDCVLLAVEDPDVLKQCVEIIQQEDAAGNTHGKGQLKVLDGMASLVALGLPAPPCITQRPPVNKTQSEALMRRLAYEELERAIAVRFEDVEGRLERTAQVTMEKEKQKLEQQQEQQQDTSSTLDLADFLSASGDANVDTSPVTVVEDFGALASTRRRLITTFKRAGKKSKATLDRDMSLKLTAHMQGKQPAEGNAHTLQPSFGGVRLPVVDALAEAKELVGDLHVVAEAAAPLFPADFKLTDYFMQRYHQRLMTLLQQLALPLNQGDELAAKDALRCVQWLQWYQAQLVHVSRGEDWRHLHLQVQHHEALLMDHFEARTRPRLLSWADNLLVQESQAEPSRDSQGCPHSSGPQDLFTNLDPAVQLVCNEFHVQDGAVVVLAKLIGGVLAHLVNGLRGLILEHPSCVEDTHTKQRRRSTKHRRSSHIEKVSQEQDGPVDLLSTPEVMFVVTQLNNCHQYEEYTEELRGTLSDHLASRSCVALQQATRHTIDHGTDQPTSPVQTFEEKLEVELDAASGLFVQLATDCARRLSAVALRTVLPMARQLFGPKLHNGHVCFDMTQQLAQQLGTLETLFARQAYFGRLVRFSACGLVRAYVQAIIDGTLVIEQGGDESVKTQMTLDGEVIANFCATYNDLLSKQALSMLSSTVDVLIAVLGGDEAFIGGQFSPLQEKIGELGLDPAVVLEKLISARKDITKTGRKEIMEDFKQSHPG